MDDYSDIINHPHHISENHPPMSMQARAAQFSPFKALVGYDEAVAETARYVEARSELDEEKVRQIDAVLRQAEGRAVSIEYFVPDDRKTGGRYVKETGRVSKVDIFEGSIVLANGTKRVAFEDIYDLSLIRPEEV